MNKAISTPIAIIIVLIVFTISIGLILLGYLYIPKPKYEPVSEEIEEMDISNWETYRNEEYGFEIKYPSFFSLEPSGRPNEVIKFTNNNDNFNINWVKFGVYLSIKGPISFDDVLETIDKNIELGYERGGIVRILNTSLVSDKRIITYESIGWPSRIPSITSIIDDDNIEVTLVLDIYGRREINIENIKKGDFSQYLDLEVFNSKMLSTFKFID